MMAGHSEPLSSTTLITDDLIPHGATIVFDWDNTLKLYDASTKQITCRVDKQLLSMWKANKQCEMFIISAIRPTKINLETILIEVERLGLARFFVKDEDAVNIVPGRYARKGNIVICGYDKAETFLELTNKAKLALDTVDSVVDVLKDSDVDTPFRQVIFFDDEEVNIHNFRALVKHSLCYHII